MAERLQFDLVAIGGGFAGLCAALRGAELGLRTAIVEAGADDGYLCSSRWAAPLLMWGYDATKTHPAAVLPRHETSLGDGLRRRIGDLARRSRDTSAMDCDKYCWKRADYSNSC